MCACKWQIFTDIDLKYVRHYLVFGVSTVLYYYQHSVTEKCQFFLSSYRFYAHKWARTRGCNSLLISNSSLDYYYFFFFYHIRKLKRLIKITLAREFIYSCCETSWLIALLSNLEKIN